jgi:hypothetical protein
MKDCPHGKSIKMDLQVQKLYRSPFAARRPIAPVEGQRRVSSRIRCRDSVPHCLTIMGNVISTARAGAVVTALIDLICSQRAQGVAEQRAPGSHQVTGA